MHLTDEDLSAAVAAGHISAAQAEALRSFVLERQRPRYVGRDEPFVLFRNFNEVFLSLGVVLIAGAAVALSGAGGVSTPWIALGAVLMWGLAEYFARRRRLTGPSVVAAAAFVSFTAGLAGQGFEAWSGTTVASLWLPSDASSAKWLAMSGAAFLAALVFYWRFHVPAVLFVLALALVGAVLAGTFRYDPAWSADHVPELAIVTGLIIFAVAMWFDLSDRERLTRRHQCGFWLHLLAAPLIVHGVFRLLIGWTSQPGDWLWGILALFCVFVVVALVIDRRAFLVAGLSYLGYAIGGSIWRIGLGTGVSVGLTFAALGIAVLVLGIGWRPIRRSVLAPLRDTALARLLPPIGAN